MEENKKYAASYPKIKKRSSENPDSGFAQGESTRYIRQRKRRVGLYLSE